MSCAVKGCRSGLRFNAGEIKFHRFPKGHLLSAWKEVLGLDEKWKWKQNEYVCSKHFKPSSYLQIGGQFMLKLDAVPFIESVGVTQECEMPDIPLTLTDLKTPSTISTTIDVTMKGVGQTNEVSNSPGTLLAGSSLVEKRKKSPDVARRKIKIGKVKLKLSTQEAEVCTLCFNRSKLELVTNAPLAKELNHFNFIEVEIGYKLPERICKECLRKLNDIASFVKMCKDSCNIYIKIEEHQNRNNENNVNENHLTTQHIDSESNELHELSSETCKPAVPNEEVRDEAISTMQETETELNIPDELRDHVYFKLNNKITNGNLQNEMKTCPTCGETVPGFGTHYKKNPRCRPKNIQCPMCPVRCRDSIRMRNHQKAHHPENVSITLSMCHICSKTFKYDTNLRRHLRVHSHGKRFICEQCGKGYTTAENLHDHQNVHLNMKQFLCAKCGKQFSTKLNLRVHERGCKCNAVRTRTVKRRIPELEKTRENELVACEICDRKFLGPGLKVHMHTHDEDRTYCRKCNTEFATTVLYRQHLKMHAKKDAVCPYCSKSYPRTGIKQHIATHTGERPFSCPECDKKFRTQVHLATHRLAIHNVNRGKPFSCKYCDQIFTFRGNLRVHERIHTGEKPYLCHVCDEAFADSKKRKKHVAQVHGEDEVQNIMLC